MKFCPVVPEICRGHVHVPKKERRIIIIRNGAKTISLQMLFGRLNYSGKKQMLIYWRIIYFSIANSVNLIKCLLLSLTVQYSNEVLYI